MNAHVDIQNRNGLDLNQMGQTVAALRNDPMLICTQN